MGVGTLKDDENLGLEIFSCFTLEPKGEDSTEEGSKRRIPEGEYLALDYVSGRFKLKTKILSNDDVPSSRGILIHYGNTAKDTEACILLGDKRDESSISNSRSTVSKFLELTTGKDLKVVIINDL
ncbi:hypothetical protein BKH40_07665 [Helicobacter sp. 11S02629-2]|nr:hypothetical protein BKH40_07665 [Helicobacter sp. 11S02629-2]